VTTGDPTTCTATVSDVGTGTQSDPEGTVAFTTNSTGDFTPASPAECSLVADGNAATFTSRCDITYTPTVAGSHTVKGTYTPTDSHDASQGDSNTVTATDAVIGGGDVNPTSTSVACSTAFVPAGSSAACTATVTDTGTASQSDPLGTVAFTTNSTGDFTPAPSCTLTPDADVATFTSSCQVSYTPTAGGFHTVTGTYTPADADPHSGSQGDSNPIHAGSSGGDTGGGGGGGGGGGTTPLASSTAVVCSPNPVVVGVPATCTATVTDTATGLTGRSDPAGTVTFTTSATGGFSVPSCTLVSDGNAATFTSSCQVTYTPGTAATHTITASYHDPSAAHTDSTGSTDLVVNATSGGGTQFQPDAQIKAKNGIRLGNAVYNTTGAGQTAKVAAARGTSVALRLFIQNDGSSADAFLLKGTHSHDGWKVTYLFGGVDITRRVVAGTYRTSDVAPGGSRILKIVVGVPRGASIGQLTTWFVRATSVGDTTKHDVVGVKVKALA
jgi:hypothetical protein